MHSALNWGLPQSVCSLGCLMVMMVGTLNLDQSERWRWGVAACARRSMHSCMERWVVRLDWGIEYEIRELFTRFGMYVGRDSAYIHICMYVRMYVCTYICMYAACMHACMHVCMYVCI